MSVRVELTENFIREAKALLKRYRSLSDDLEQLMGELMTNPRLGTPLGNGAFKIRLRIKSKGKGKSGGARVISFLNNDVVAITKKQLSGETVVYLLSIYDKSDTATISNKELQELIDLLIKK